MLIFTRLLCLGYSKLGFGGGGGGEVWGFVLVLFKFKVLT